MTRPDTQAAVYQPIEDTRGLSKEMRAILPKQRAFVISLIESGGQNASKAARLAGYGNTPTSSRVAAFRLMHDAKVLAAIKSEADRKIHASVLLGAQTLVEIASDPMHKDRLKAATQLLDRGGLLLATQHNVNVNVSTPEGDGQVVTQIRVLAGQLGLDPEVFLGRAGKGLPALAPPPVEEALDAGFEDAEDTVPTSEGLEDLLG